MTEDLNGKYVDNGKIKLPLKISRPKMDNNVVMHKDDVSKANNPINLESVADAYLAGYRTAPSICNFINGKFDCNPDGKVIKLPNGKSRSYNMTVRSNQADIDLVNALIKEHWLGLMVLPSKDRAVSDEPDSPSPFVSVEPMAVSHSSKIQDKSKSCEIVNDNTTYRFKDTNDVHRDEIGE